MYCEYEIFFDSCFLFLLFRKGEFYVIFYLIYVNLVYWNIIFGDFGWLFWVYLLV